MKPEITCFDIENYNSMLFINAKAMRNRSLFPKTKYVTHLGVILWSLFRKCNCSSLGFWPSYLRRTQGLGSDCSIWPVSLPNAGAAQAWLRKHLHPSPPSPPTPCQQPRAPLCPTTSPPQVASNSSTQFQHLPHLGHPGPGSPDPSCDRRPLRRTNFWAGSSW